MGLKMGAPYYDMFILTLGGTVFTSCEEFGLSDPNYKELYIHQKQHSMLTATLVLHFSVITKNLVLDINAKNSHTLG